MTMLSFSVVDADGATVVALAGELDLYTTPNLRELVGSLIDEGRLRVVLDLSALTFCDASGLGELVRCRRVLREHDGWLSLLHVRPQTVKMIRLTGLGSVLPVYSSLPESAAAAAWEQSAQATPKTSCRR
jgi:anti-sigma B factor antagonist